MARRGRQVDVVGPGSPDRKEPKAGCARQDPLRESRGSADIDDYLGLPDARCEPLLRTGQAVVIVDSPALKQPAIGAAPGHDGGRIIRYHNLCLGQHSYSVLLR